MVGLTSAAGLVGFLSEPDPALQAFALERLNHEVDSVWTEISGSIGQMYVTLRTGDGVFHANRVVLCSFGICATS